MIVAWSLLYIFVIITGRTYVWSSCMNDFNTLYCSSSLEDKRCSDELSTATQSISAFFFNRTCFTVDNIEMRTRQKDTFTHLPAVSPAEEFFEVNYTKIINRLS